MNKSAVSVYSLKMGYIIITYLSNEVVYMKAKVDPDICIGCGLCPSIAPEVFEMGDDGHAHAISEDVPEGTEGEAQEAADSCPVSAITVDEP